jgi:nucleotide-binding universal stress UspA family protein
VKITDVLYATDLSEASAHAAEWAIAVAGFYNASITALHVVSPILVSVPGLGTSIPGESIEETERERLRRDVAARFSQTLTHVNQPDVRIDVGEPTHRILERAAGLPADLIVMGTHGTSGFEHLVLGSVTEKVLRRACCPVLTVPPRAQATSRLPFRRLLCAIDFSHSSLGALELALSLAKQSDAALTLLHVLEWPWEEPPPPPVEALPIEQGVALAEFRRYCEQSAKKRLESLVPDSLRVSQRPVGRVRSGKSYVQILQTAAEEGTDLIVIGVHGRNPLDMALFGSTANQIVRRATCPVLTLRSETSSLKRTSSGDGANTDE